MSKNTEPKQLSNFEQLVRAIDKHEVDKAKKLIKTMEPEEFSKTNSRGANPLQ